MRNRAWIQRIPILVVAPDYELRRSIEFALHAEGFPFTSSPTLKSAISEDNGMNCACAIIDEKAVGLRGEHDDLLERIDMPVVMLVDSLQVFPKIDVLKTLSKPLLGAFLIDAVLELVV